MNMYSPQVTNNMDTQIRDIVEQEAQQTEQQVLQSVESLGETPTPEQETEIQMQQSFLQSIEALEKDIVDSQKAALQQASST